MRMSQNYLVEDVELSFKLLEFAIRVMCYSELDNINPEVFGQELQLNLDEENVSFSDDVFKDKEEIIRASQMNVGPAFAATAISLHRLMEGKQDFPSNIEAACKVISAVRNAFSHGIASPSWFVKRHKREEIDLGFVSGPIVDLGALNGSQFEYSHIGGLAVWYHLRDEIFGYVKNT